jgi:hypothetical protein
VAHTNLLIIGGITLIVGLLTIPLVIGCGIAPMGCLILLVALFISDSVPPQAVVVTQPGYQQPVQQYQQPARDFPQQPKL